MGSSNSNETAEEGRSGVEVVVEIAGGRRCSLGGDVPSSGESSEIVGGVARALNVDWASRGVAPPRLGCEEAPSKLGRGDLEALISRGEPNIPLGLSICGDGESRGEFDGEVESDGEGELDRLPFFFLFAKLFFNHPFAFPIRVLSSTSNSLTLPSIAPNPSPKRRSALLD